MIWPTLLLFACLTKFIAAESPIIPLPPQSISDPNPAGDVLGPFQNSGLIPQFETYLADQPLHPPLNTKTFEEALIKMRDLKPRIPRTYIDKEAPIEDTYAETERRLIVTWVAVVLSLIAFIAVYATANMPIARDPLLYTKIYTGNAHMQ